MLLEFDCTNNNVEYEPLTIGLYLALDRNIKCLKVIGDFDLVVSQVKRKFATKNERLRIYRNLILDTIERFEAFSIEVVPRDKNHVVDALVMSIAILQPCEETLCDQCKMEVIFRQSLPNKWQIFNDDAQILRVQHNMHEFSNSQINFLAESMNLRVEYLPNDTHPKGVVPLERMFDRHDMYKESLLLINMMKQLSLTLVLKIILG
jgi:hypothetical protein